MPEAYVRYGQQWQELNPDWTVIDWTERAVEDFPDVEHVLEDLYYRDNGRKGIELYVQLADVIGYCLVREWGGVYVNCDMQPVRPLPSLPDLAWASYENHVDGRIVNAAIGAPQPWDPFWTGLVDELPARYWAYRYDEMVMSTGPAFLTDFARRNNKIHVFPVETFNPVHWKDIPAGGDASGREYPPETIAVHHWGHKKDGRTNKIESATQ